MIQKSQNDVKLSEKINTSGRKHIKELQKRTQVSVFYKRACGVHYSHPITEFKNFTLLINRPNSDLFCSSEELYTVDHLESCSS